VEEAAVPASVQAVLAARIDRLEHRDKAVLQAAAVIGKEFSAAVLGRVAELPPGVLEGALRDLVAAEFVYEQELYPEALYAFKHPLTQEVAYGSQLSERRAPVHAAVARALAEQYHERLDERAALLARHWQAAGERLEAARWHARAAAWAGSNDPTHAQPHWNAVRELADALPETQETVALGLESRIASLNYGWRLGMSTEQADALFAEAERMATDTQDTRSRAFLFSLYGAVKGLSHGSVRGYTTLARPAIALAEASRDPAVYLAVAPTAYAFLCTGEHRRVLAICDRAIELADGDPTMGAGVAIACPYAMCHGLKGLSLTNLGELAEGARLLEQARQIAREQGDLEAVGYYHQWSVTLAYFQGEPETALRHAEQTLASAERNGGSLARANAAFVLGWAKQMRGDWRAAIDSLEQSLAIARECGAAADSDASRLSLLGEAYLGLGDAERARALVTEGLELAHARGHRPDETHASLALARVLLRCGGARPPMDAALSRALELARRTGARVFEPLIHVELAEVARQSDDLDGHDRQLREAHRLFAEIGATGHAGRLELQLTVVT